MQGLPHVCFRPWRCSETWRVCRKDVPPKEKPFRAADVEKVLAVRDAEHGQEVFVKLKGGVLPAMVLQPLCTGHMHVSNLAETALVPLKPPCIDDNVSMDVMGPVTKHGHADLV